MTDLDETLAEGMRRERREAVARLLADTVTGDDVRFARKALGMRAMDFAAAFTLTVDGIDVTLTPEIETMETDRKWEPITIHIESGIDDEFFNRLRRATLTAETVMYDERERFLATRHALRARLTAPRPPVNPLPFDGVTFHGRLADYRRAWGTTCEARAMRCRARRHGRLPTCALTERESTARQAESSQAC